jgi:hypothetical protein
MLPIFNEYKHATDMNNGTASDRDREEKRIYSFRDLVIYTKWLRWSLWSSESNEEEKDKKVYNGLITFCEQLQMYFNLDTDYSKINNIIKQSKQYKLRTCQPSYITNNEWSQIMSIPDERARKAYFALLVLCKFNRNNPVQDITASDRVYEDVRFKTNYALSDIYKYGGVKFTRKEIQENPKVFYAPIMTLQEMGLIEKYLSKNKCTLILNSADVNVDMDDVYMTITKYEDVESYYKYGMKENKYKICPKCGLAFKGNRNNNDKYCRECADKDNSSFHYIHCEDCGKRIKISNKNTKTTRCKECQSKYIRIYDKNRKFRLANES